MGGGRYGLTCTAACISVTEAETVATGCKVTVRCHGNRAEAPALFGQGGSEQLSRWMAQPIQAQDSLEKQWVDETRDFLSASPASPALLCLPPSICFRPLEWQLCHKNTSLKAAGTQKAGSTDENDNLYVT